MQGDFAQHLSRGSQPMNSKGSRFPPLPDSYLLTSVQAVTILPHFPSLSQLQLITSSPLSTAQDIQLQVS